VLAKLAGAEYRVQDMWQLLGEWRGVGRAASEGVVVLCNPPRYDGGYEKMFAGVEQVVAWDAPGVAQFGEADYQRLMDWWGEAAEESPLMLVYYATSIAGGGKDPAVEWGGGWRSVFAARPKSAETAAINWVVASREPRAATSGARVAVGLQRQDVEPEVRAKYKLFREGEITAASELRMVTETKAVASYYRDLMTHRLGMINAERYKILLLDGELMGCVGVHLQNLRSSGTLSGWAKLVFAMSPEHVRYRLLHKLTLMCVVSTWFWQGDVGDMELLPHGVQTTMLTRWPEVKTARGIFTLHEREYSQAKMEYRLTYQAKLTERTPAETVCEWLKRYGSEMKRGSGITQTSGVSGR
jgi:hypothetical protein